MEFGELVGSQHGAFTWPQAREAGFSNFRIRRRVSTGEWSVATPKVLVLGPPGADRRQADWIALLTAGPGAVLAAFSAVRFHGLESPSRQVCVIVPPPRHLKLPGVRVLRHRLIDEDVTLVNDALVTCCARTVIDCLLLLPHRQALNYLDRALQQRWISHEELLRRVEARAGHRGTRKLRQLADLVSGGAQFEGERRLVALLRQHGFAGWTCNQSLPGVGVLDVAFPKLLLAIEVDGVAWHSDVQRFQADRTKQNKLTAAGWTVLRFTWRDLTESPDVVSATIAATIQRLAAA